ncbi:hypothetical protein MRB53_010127 [Persea americana]|uniref:Uncharacterized protein n=1 Tax=Persea americana TaxID=3435 RepID=A0ACC2LR58_PERAE|nr:hypothetical protein MRB53_010127 [Persea americana]
MDTLLFLAANKIRSRLNLITPSAQLDLTRNHYHPSPERLSQHTKTHRRRNPLFSCPSLFLLFDPDGIDGRDDSTNLSSSSTLLSHLMEEESLALQVVQCCLFFC